MKRPALQAAIAFIAGITASLYIKQIIVIILIFLILIVLYYYSVRKEVHAFKNLLIWNVFFLLGYVNFAAQYTYMLMPVLQNYDAEVTVKGYICDYYRSDDNKAVSYTHLDVYKRQALPRTAVQGWSTPIITQTSRV